MPKNFRGTNDSTDIHLIELVKNSGDNDSFKEICSRYENVFYKICQKYASTLMSVGVDPKDIFEEKNCIILDCIKKFDPSKNTKLSTFIGNYARYLCLNSINERKFIMPSMPDDTSKFIEEKQQKTNYNNESFNKEDYNYVANLLEQLKDERIKQIIYLRYFANNKKMIWSDVSKKMGISTQTILTLHGRGMELLRNKIKSHNISDKI